MQIRLLDVAQKELDEAVNYHNAESPGLGDQFLIEALAASTEFGNFPKHGIRTPRAVGAARLSDFLTVLFIRFWKLKY